MRTHRSVFFYLALVGLFLIPGVASGQQAVDPSSANSGRTPAENGPSPATAQKPAPLSPFETAMILYRNREFAEAAAALDQISRSGDADSAKAFAWLARTDLRLGKIAEAEAAAQRALAISANLPTGHAALGEVYFRQGKFADAEKEFLTPLKAGIPDPRAYLGEGRLSWASSNQIHGKKLIDKAHALDPQDPEIRAWWLSTLSRAERVAYLVNEVHPGNSTDPGHRPSPTGASNEPANNPPPEANCHLVAPGTTAEFPLEGLMFKADVIRGFALNVKLNGNPSRLLLDSGASGITVNSKLAEHAGVRHIADTRLAGFGDEGAAKAYVGYVDSIQIGGLEFKGCLVAVLDQKRSLGEDGLIGPDAFQDFLVDINFPDQKLSLSPLPKIAGAAEPPLGLRSEENNPVQLHDRYIAPEMQTYERFYRFEHDILVPTLVNTTANSRLFLMDTGSESMLLSVDFARQVTRVHHDDTTKVLGVSGTVKNVYIADGVDIAFPYSRLKIPVNNVTALDLSGISNGAGTDVSGVLGFTFLWLLDIKIDYRDGLVNFSFDPHRMH